MAASKIVDGRSREAFWRVHVEAWMSSGETLSGYCLEQCLSESNFYYWRKKLAKVKSYSPHPEPAPSFVEMEIRSRGETAIEIALGEVRRIQVHPGFDEETLARVVAVLERAGC